MKESIDLKKSGNQKRKTRIHKRVKKVIKNLSSTESSSKYIMATTTYSDFKETKMTFGKYKGYFMKDIPTDYLKWLILNVTDRGLCEMYAIELQRRSPKWRK